MPENKRIFLTGHRGCLGSNLLPKLIESGYEVETDMRYYDQNKWACVIHLAGNKNTSTEFDPAIYYDNIILTERIFRNSSRIIAASSCIAPYNCSPYAASKLWTEHLAVKHGNAMALRFHNIYAKNATSGLIKMLLAAKDGDQLLIRGAGLVRDYLYAQNAVDIIFNLMDCVNIGISEIGTGRGFKTLDVVSKFSEISGRKFIIESVEPNKYEPPSMVALTYQKRFVQLEEGLAKILNG